VKYIGRSLETPPDGWRVVEFANGWIGADNDSDDYGPRIFKPTTVQLESGEVGVLRASKAGYDRDPDSERGTVGQFWDMWVLHDDGTFSRKGRAA
jgi:hypothetical protein